MNNFLRVGLAAVAVVVIAVIAINLLPGSPAPGGQPTESVAPSEAEPTVEPSSAAGLPVGSTFDLAYGDRQPRIPVTIPAPGWFGDLGGGILIKNDNSDPPDGAGIITFIGDDLYVYGDPCDWSTTRPDTPATTIDELVAALAAQASRDASGAADITLDGYAGKSITLHVPDDAAYSAGEFSDCDQGKFASWGVAGEDPARWHQGPGQIDELWILDVDGVLVVIDTAHYAGTPTADLDELRAIVESATFTSP